MQLNKAILFFTAEHLLSFGVKISEQNCHLSLESSSFVRERG